MDTNSNIQTCDQYKMLRKSRPRFKHILFINKAKFLFFFLNDQLIPPSLPQTILNLEQFSWSALLIKTKNHVRACSLLKKIPCIHFICAKTKQYTYKSHCFKIYFHAYTGVQKQMQKLYIICVQMFGNVKIWPCYMFNIKS